MAMTSWVAKRSRARSYGTIGPEDHTQRYALPMSLVEQKGMVQVCVCVCVGGCLLLPQKNNLSILFLPKFSVWDCVCLYLPRIRFHSRDSLKGNSSPVWFQVSLAQE